MAAGVGVAVEIGVALAGGVGVGVGAGVAESSWAPLKFADATTSKNADDVTTMFIARKSFEIRTIRPELNMCSPVRKMRHDSGAFDPRLT